MGGKNKHNTIFFDLRLLVESIEDSRGESHDVVAQPISEQALVKALTEQAHKIATTVLEQPGTGEDLINDAQVRIVHCKKCYNQISPMFATPALSLMSSVLFFIILFICTIYLNILISVLSSKSYAAFFSAQVSCPHIRTGQIL